MLPEIRQRPLIMLGERGLRVARVLLAAMAVLVIAEGMVLLVVRGLPDFGGRTSIGLWLVVLGSAMGLYAWRGRWTPAVSEEEKACESQFTRRLDVVLSGVELLFLSLALLGLLVPSVLGGLWEEYRSSVTFLLALVLLDVAVRIVRKYGSVQTTQEAE
ncbi:MAG: hypothetical protein ACYC3F_15390 [Gemmatimonadaceae bacterium]